MKSIVSASLVAGLLGTAGLLAAPPVHAKASPGGPQAMMSKSTVTAHQAVTSLVAKKATKKKHKKKLKR